MPGKTFSLTRDRVRRALSIPSKHFLERGFSPEVLDAFDVGESAKLRRTVVPLYDDAGGLCIGNTVRSYQPHCESCRKHHDPGVECRWGQQKWGIMKGFPKRTYLYNFAKAVRAETRAVFLVEGPPDVWRLAEAGHVGVALLGSDATEQQIRKLASLDRAITVALDNDEPGRAATERLRKALRCDFFPIPAPYKDFGETPASVLREAIGRR